MLDKETPWTGTWPSNATAKRSRASVEALFAMLGLDGDGHGGADSAAPPPRRAARAPARRIRRAAPYRHRGPRPCGEACCLASDAHAGGSQSGRAAGTPLPPSSSSIRGKTSQSCASAAESSRGIPRASISSDLIPGWQPCGQRRPPVADPAPPPDGLVNAERLTRRLQALKLALEDLPRQARRLARWRVRRESTPKSEVQVAAPAGPSSRLPQEADSRSR